MDRKCAIAHQGGENRADSAGLLQRIVGRLCDMIGHSLSNVRNDRTTCTLRGYLVYCTYEVHVVERDAAMQTAVTKRGQTVIPAPIRKRYQIQEGDSLVWIDDGETIRVIPVAHDPIGALRGIGRGESLTERLLARRQEDRVRA